MPGDVREKAQKSPTRLIPLPFFWRLALGLIEGAKSEPRLDKIGSLHEVHATLQDWMDEIERVHLILRLSARLRQKHGD